MNWMLRLEISSDDINIMDGRPLGDFTQTLTIAQASRAATDDHIALSGSSLKNYLLGVTIDN